MSEEGALGGAVGVTFYVSGTVNVHGGATVANVCAFSVAGCAVVGACSVSRVGMNAIDGARCALVNGSDAFIDGSDASVDGSDAFLGASDASSRPLVPTAGRALASLPSCYSRGSRRRSPERRGFASRATSARAASGSSTR